MGKRKNKDPGGNGRQVHPQRSFEQIVADATLTRLGGYIDSEIQQAAQAILARQQQAMGNLLTRLVATEEILCEKFEITKDDLATRVAAVQDRFEGFEQVAEGGVEKGDRVRVEIKTRTADQAEYQGSSRLQVDNIGSGNTLGTELETAIVGMKVGEVKEVKFGKDESMAASIALNRISRQPKAEEKKEENKAPAAEEAPNVGATAG